MPEDVPSMEGLDARSRTELPVATTPWLPAPDSSCTGQQTFGKAIANKMSMVASYAALTQPPGL